MKTDPLEEFIRQNRNAFDREVAPPSLWEKPEPAPQKRILLRGYTRYILQAAAAVLIFVMAWTTNDLYRSRQHKTNPAENQEMQSAELPAKLQEAENYYSGLIENKKQELFRLTSTAPDVKKDINMEMEELDKTFRELKADLNDNADNQEVIEAMIGTYQLKLRILEDMLHMLKTSKSNPKKQLNETNQIQL